MQRFLSLKSETLVGPSESVVEVAHDEVGLLALEITLLLERLVDCLTVNDPQGFGMMLVVASRQGGAAVSHAGTKRLSVELGRSQGEHLQAVLLRAFRDGAAEVNHVHLEGELEGRQYDLTIMFEVSQPPMSPDEAARLMDT